MREILFRGKSIFTNKWVEGYYRKIESNNPDQDTPYLIYDMVNQDWMVDPDTISQYTGLIDGNGKKIFEGDILQFGVHRLIVYWDEESFQWTAKKTKGYDIIHFCHENPRGFWNSIDLGEIAAEEIITGKMTTVIIGNIYDNADLIEDSTDDSNSDFSWEF